MVKLGNVAVGRSDLAAGAGRSRGIDAHTRDGTMIQA